LPEKFIPFTNFAPGSPEHGTGLLRAENVIPAMGSWRPMSQISRGVNALSPFDQVIGGYVHVYPSGIGSGAYIGDAPTEFWGTLNTLQVYASGAFTDISRGGGYSAGALVGSEWNFTSFGNDVWAANAVDVLQRRTNNAGNFANGVTSAFVPTARFVATVREFLVAGFLNQANRFADEIAISDIGDATYFSPADATRPSSVAYSQRVRGRPGQITGLVGGQFGRIFKRRSIHSLIFTGAQDFPWNVEEISGTTGTPCGKSIVECSDGFLRFWGGDGFYRQAGTAPPEKISPPTLNNLLLEAHMDTVWQYRVTRFEPVVMYQEGLRFQGAESRQSGLVFWLYLTAANDDVLNVRMIAHDPVSGEWGLINLEDAAGAGYTAGSEGLTCLISSPINRAQSSSLTWDLIGCENVGETLRISFDSVNPMQATFATQRFSLAGEGELSTASPRITGFLPVMAREATSGSPDYNLRALPEGVTVRIVGANDPHFVDIVDSGGTQVSPRSEVFIRDTDFGWWTGSLQARWFIAEMVYPAGGVNERGFLGGYVRWE
jgi:hypothetical protein